jgi:hypothetical protein
MLLTSSLPETLPIISPPPPPPQQQNNYTQVNSLVLANYEKYSSMLKDFQVLASTSYPTNEWINLGTYTAMPVLGEQLYPITERVSAHSRYLKIKFLTHYQDETLCTLSHVKVHGMTVIASFKAEVEDSMSDEMVRLLAFCLVISFYICLLNTARNSPANSLSQLAQRSQSARKALAKRSQSARKALAKRSKSVRKAFAKRSQSVRKAFAKRSQSVRKAFAKRSQSVR